LLFLFVAWQLWWTDVTANRAQASTIQTLEKGFGPAELPAPRASDPLATLTKVPFGQAFAILRIPRFGADHAKPVLEGTDRDTLIKGMGHYSGTAFPGQVGNFALAGHRITHGEPFARLLELKVGDKIIITTKTTVFTYEIDKPPSQLTVKDVDTWVLDPVPGKANVKPTQALITLTTCQDLFHSPDRSVGFGHLVGTTKR
jgi:sortase A